MNKQQLIRNLFGDKIPAVLDVFLQNPTTEFLIKDISEQSKIPLTSCYRIIRKLLKSKIVEEVKVLRFVAYKLAKSQHNAFLESIIIEEKHLVDEFVQRIKNTPGIDQIILHGVETKDKANLLVIGKNIDADVFKPAIADFRLNKKFTISALTLDPDQYEQMSEMGLYSGKKKILFNK